MQAELIKSSKNTTSLGLQQASSREGKGFAPSDNNLGDDTLAASLQKNVIFLEFVENNCLIFWNDSSRV